MSDDDNDDVDDDEYDVDDDDQGFALDLGGTLSHSIASVNAHLRHQNVEKHERSVTLARVWLLVPVLSISQFVNLLGFTQTTISRVHIEWCKSGEQQVYGRKQKSISAQTTH